MQLILINTPKSDGTPFCIIWWAPHNKKASLLMPSEFYSVQAWWLSLREPLSQPLPDPVFKYILCFKDCRNSEQNFQWVLLPFYLVPSDGHAFAGLVLHPSVFGFSEIAEFESHGMPQFLIPTFLLGTGEGNAYIKLTFLLNLDYKTWVFWLQDYSTSGLSHGLLVFLQHLREFGLVYQRKVRASNENPEYK